MTPELAIVTVAMGSAEAAADMATALVENRLAACAQVAPITSTYRWEGRVVTESEWLVTAKTLAGALAALEAFVRARHAYAVPEIVAVPAIWASAPYARWVAENVDVA